MKQLVCLLLSGASLCSYAQVPRGTSSILDLFTAAHVNYPFCDGPNGTTLYVHYPTDRNYPDTYSLNDDLNLYTGALSAKNGALDWSHIFLLSYTNGGSSWTVEDGKWIEKANHLPWMGCYPKIINWKAFDPKNWSVARPEEKHVDDGII